MTNPMLEKLIRFQRPENALPFAQGLSARTLAAMFGSEELEYRSVVDGLDRGLTETASRIAVTPSGRACLQALPFEEDAHLVAIGESTTADRLSWFEILRTLLETHRPDLKLRFTNIAAPGATTAQMLAMVARIRRLAPDCVFCMLGTNDAQRLDAPDGPFLVSPDETRRNLIELRARALPSDDCGWVWVTPTPVDEERIARFPFFADSGIGWKNRDLDELFQTLPTRNDLVIDSSTAVRPDDPDALADDGLHPSAAAQEALAARILRALAEEARWSSSSSEREAARGSTTRPDRRTGRVTANRSNREAE